MGLCDKPVANPNLQMGAGGGGTVSKNFFSELQASVWSKNKGGGAGPGPSGLSPRSATTNVLHTARTGMSL